MRGLQPETLDTRDTEILCRCRAFTIKDHPNLMNETRLLQSPIRMKEYGKFGMNEIVMKAHQFATNRCMQISIVRLMMNE